MASLFWQFRWRLEHYCLQPHGALCGRPSRISLFGCLFCSINYDLMSNFFFHLSAVTHRTQINPSLPPLSSVVWIGMILFRTSLFLRSFATFSLKHIPSSSHSNYGCCSNYLLRFFFFLTHSVWAYISQSIVSYRFSLLYIANSDLRFSGLVIQFLVLVIILHYDLQSESFEYWNTQPTKLF